MLQNFGGERITLKLPKTGLPFFDALRLYGTIDLYVGLREDTHIHDCGDAWQIQGLSRRNRISQKPETAFKHVWHKKRPDPTSYCAHLRSSLTNGTALDSLQRAPAKGPFSGLDSALQSGIRGTAAARYETLQSSQTSATQCIADISLSDGLLAFAGKKRVEGLGSITYLPLFEGQVDLSKVVSPLRAWIGLPNVLCSQMLALLALKTSLLAEGYAQNLTGVAFNTAFGGQRSDNYSGLITISSTAIGRMSARVPHSATGTHGLALVSHTYAVFRGLVSRAWEKAGRDYRTTQFTEHALAMAYWLMQPVAKHLTSMITSQERLCHQGAQHLFTTADHVRKVFEMSYGQWNGNDESIQRFAKAVASGIYFARMVNQPKPSDRRKAWYEEIAMLRSAPTSRAFIERALILIEQGHREQGQVGTAHRDETFDPKLLFESMGNDQTSFETFRDLFRMYLVQQSSYQAREESSTGSAPDDPSGISETNGSEEDSE